MATVMKQRQAKLRNSMTPAELILKDILTFPVLGRKYTNKAIARANGKAGMAKRFDSVAGLPTMTVAEGFRSRRKT